MPVKYTLNGVCVVANHPVHAWYIYIQLLFFANAASLVAEELIFPPNFRILGAVLIPRIFVRASAGRISVEYHFHK